MRSSPPQTFRNGWLHCSLLPVMFRVGPHGETALSHTSDGYFKYWDGGELLRKVTQDLLQTQFSPQPVAAGASWKPRGQFAYPHDRALKDLELSGADLRFRNLVKVDGRSCAWVTSQYVFSPIDLPAVGTASGGRVVPAAGNNAVAAVLHISLLLDPASHHVVWLHRAQTIDNKLTLASPYDDADADPPPDNPSEPDDPENPMPDLSSMRSDNPGRYPFMTFHFQEEARARLLPDERSVEWLAALKSFEATPEPESGNIPVSSTKTLLPESDDSGCETRSREADDARGGRFRFSRGNAGWIFALRKGTVPRRLVLRDCVRGLARRRASFRGHSVTHDLSRAKRRPSRQRCARTGTGSTIPRLNR